MNKTITLIMKYRLHWIGYISLVSAIIYLKMSSHGYDDPYITYRYAENIAQGNGFVYNIGENVLSTTTPLFAILLAICGYLGAAIPKTAVLFGAISQALGGLLIWLISDDLKRDRDQVNYVGLLGLFCYPIIPIVLVTLSSETPLYLMLSLAVVYSYLRREFILCGILLGLATLTRGDAMILIGVMGADWILQGQQRPKLPWKIGYGFLAIMIPWIIYGYLSFGSPVPVTLFVKQSQALLPESRSFLTRLWIIMGELIVIPAYTVLILLAILGFVKSFVNDHRWIILSSWPVLYTTAYTILNPSSYYWYYAPIFPGLLICAGLGAQTLIDALKWLIGKRSDRFLKIPQMLFWVPIALFFYTFAQGLNNLSDWVDPRIDIYREIGLWVTENSDENAKIGTLEVGIIGYYAMPNPMIDFAGLTRPRVAEQFQSSFSYGQAELWTIKEYQLDYIISYNLNLMEQLDENSIGRCKRVKTFEGVQYNFTSDMYIYQCDYP